MEENPSSKHRNVPTKRKNHPILVDETGDPIKCTGRHCQSCTAGVIADCIAVCCCPCAFLSCFTLAFLKAPYLMGRRCLGLGKRKEKPKKCESGGENANLENIGAEMESLEISRDGFEDEDREEEERVWLELYQLGHLGFGRVSFTGIQSQGKSN